MFPALLGAREMGSRTASESPVAEVLKTPKDKSAIGLLPSGSVLDGVMFPRYDEDRHLLDVMKAARMTIIDAERVKGEQVAIEFYNPDQSPRGRVDMETAYFNQKTGILKSENPVDIRSDRMFAHGQGLYYSMQDGKGFLPGPAITRISSPPATAMNIPSPLRASALLGFSMLPLIAAQPPIQAPPAGDTASKAPEVNIINKETRASLRADLERSSNATKDATKFLESAELISSEPAATAPVPAAKPLEVTPKPEDTVINCSGGMYFDSTNGVLVYLRDVKVVDPRFDLSGADEVKVFFEKKPETPSPQPAKDPKKSDQKTTDKDKDDLNMAPKGGFGNAEKIVATGAVRVLQKSVEKGKEPVEASAGVLVYDVKTGDITLSGRYPWVMQGATYSRAKEPDLTLKIFKNNTFSTQGNWEMGGPLNQKK